MLLRCLGHVIALTELAIMSAIAKIGATQNTMAIWEYDPALEDNRVLGSQLNVIVAIRTLTIKVQPFDLYSNWSLLTSL